MKSVQLKMSSLTPLIMHNGQMANPLHPISLEIKKISGKRGKTEADLQELARLEFLGGLYLSDGKPCIPGKMLVASLRNGARRLRSGKKVEAGVFCQRSFPLLYDGPAKPEQLWADESYRLVEIVRVTTSRIVRTRPKFEKWGAEIEFLFNENVINSSDIVEWMSVAGEQVGIGDWRSGGYGLYTIEKI